MISHTRHKIRSFRAFPYEESRQFTRPDLLVLFDWLVCTELMPPQEKEEGEEETLTATAYQVNEVNRCLPWASVPGSLGVPAQVSQSPVLPQFPHPVLSPSRSLSSPSPSDPHASLPLDSSHSFSEPRLRWGCLEAASFLALCPPGTSPHVSTIS